MRQSGKTIANTQYITGIDVSNNLQDLIKANLVTTGDMDTVTIDASGDGTVSPGSLYVANSLQELFDAGQHVSVFSQVTYGDAAEMEAGSNEAAGTAGVNKDQTVDFSNEKEPYGVIVKFFDDNYNTDKWIDFQKGSGRL